MASKLSIYNQALLLMKERRLSSLSEDRESRRVLDELWIPLFYFCLEQGMWKFAMRSATLSQVGAGLYGFTYKYNKPSDFIHLFSASENASYDPPLVYGFADEGPYFYGNVSNLRIRYASKGSSYGGNEAAWPYGYAEYVATELASWACYAITGNERLAMYLDRRAKILLANALSLYCMTAPPGQLPFNTWARSVTASEAVNMRPELLPFGAEVKALLASDKGQQGQ